MTMTGPANDASNAVDPTELYENEVIGKESASSYEQAPSGTRRGGGPRTERGKRIVSQNAITHGLTSTNPVTGGEKQEEWEEFLQGIHESCAPVGVLEEELVSELALNRWRKRRLIRYETGRVQTRYEAIRDSNRPQSTELATDPRSLFLLRLAGSTYLIEQAQGSEDDATPVEESSIEDLRLLVAQPDDEFRWPRPAGGWTLGDLRRWIDAYAANRGKTSQEFIGAIQALAERMRFKLLGRHRAEYGPPTTVMPREWRERQALIPHSDDLERIIRNESHLDRSFERTLRQLEQLQRARDGDLPPHPLRINLGTA